MLQNASTFIIIFLFIKWNITSKHFFFLIWGAPKSLFHTDALTSSSQMIITPYSATKWSSASGI